MFLCIYASQGHNPYLSCQSSFTRPYHSFYWFVRRRLTHFNSMSDFENLINHEKITLQMYYTVDINWVLNKAKMFWCPDVGSFYDL